MGTTHWATLPTMPLHLQINECPLSCPSGCELQRKNHLVRSHRGVAGLSISPLDSRSSAPYLCSPCLHHKAKATGWETAHAWKGVQLHVSVLPAALSVAGLARNAPVHLSTALFPKPPLSIPPPKETRVLVSTLGSAVAFSPYCAAPASLHQAASL